MSWYAPGKLLLSGEYVVLDGALALALPCRLGQGLSLAPAGRPELRWTSLDHKGEPWLRVSFDLPLAANAPSGLDPASQRLLEILLAVEELRPGFWEQAAPVAVTTRLGFPRDWGLGSSSTLLALLSRWAQVDAFALLDRTFGGSGYDIACAQAAGPILYRRMPEGPRYVEVPFHPPFARSLYFVHLGRKQDSREGIRRYRNQPRPGAAWLARFDECSLRLLRADSLDVFEAELHWHERELAEHLQLEPIQDHRFPAYWGTVKSLGAWGGDFALATSSRSEAETRAYFEALGYPTIFAYHDLVLAP